MTTSEFTGLVSALGFPIVLVAVMLWFFGKSVWPWHVKRQAEQDAAQAALYDRFLLALDRLIAKMDTQHAEVIQELRGLRQRPTHTEPDVIDDYQAAHPARRRE